MGEFAIGQGVPRFEDPRLVRGEGRYVGDVESPRLLHVAFVRSLHAHARVREIDAAAAKETGKVCSAANDNAPGQVVVSGHKEAVERAIAIAAEKGAKRSVLLPVSAPFHCALMQPAADAMGEALEKATVNVPAVPVIAITIQVITGDASFTMNGIAMAAAANPPITSAPCGSGPGGAA